MTIPGVEDFDIVCHYLQSMETKVEENKYIKHDYIILDVSDLLTNIFNVLKKSDIFIEYYLHDNTVSNSIIRNIFNLIYLNWDTNSIIDVHNELAVELAYYNYDSSIVSNISSLIEPIAGMIRSYFSSKLVYYYGNLHIISDSELLLSSLKNYKRVGTIKKLHYHMDTNDIYGKVFIDVMYI